MASGTQLTHALCLAGAQSARAPDKVWFDSKPGLPNEAEVLFYAILVANLDRSVADLDLWASKVLEEEPRRLELGSGWTGLADFNAARRLQRSEIKKTREAEDAKLKKAQIPKKLSQMEMDDNYNKSWLK